MKKINTKKCGEIVNGPTDERFGIIRCPSFHRKIYSATRAPISTRPRLLTFFDTFRSSASLLNKGAEREDYSSRHISITVSELHSLSCSAPLLKCQKSVKNLG